MDKINKVSEKQAPYNVFFLASKGDFKKWDKVIQTWQGDFKPVYEYPNSINDYTHWRWMK